MVNLTDIWQHIQLNWHKYGIAFLVLNHLIEKMRSVKDNASWVWEKIKWPFKKIYKLCNKYLQKRF